ncbi:hypothetical protein ABOZ73_15855 [Caulobacter sp. 73W]|uniref:Nucleoside 2-deoxyribosyltransferase n=1 Tax=Caulobacter sp. 73W TaxID=3161137 RepID=A0AB39KQT6_9CAUL
MRVYLSGSVKKGSTNSRSSSNFWTEDDEALIVDQLGPDTVLLNPSKSPIQRNDYFANYGCDLYLIYSSDVVLADLRREKGIGVGAELMFARMCDKPIVSWVPQESHYRRSKVPNVFGEDLENWVHPFAFGLSDALSETLAEACEIIAQRFSAGERAEEIISHSPAAAIEYFLKLYPHLEHNGT